ncbi:MAG: 4Fe-4S binding protein [Lachnospiraceae bacterium]|nr:4Fe-4S binding protein [Lachnospiraceae bacterium]
MKSKKYAQVNRAECVACGACTKECPRNAIEIRMGSYALVHSDICVGCGKCASICPAGSIEILVREDRDE